MIVDLNTYTDDDFVESFQYQTSLGVPINLGTNTLRMHARLDAADSTVYIECSTANGNIVITNAAIGLFTLTIPLAILQNLDPGVYTHSLIMTDPSTKIRSDIWRGTITHAAGPTRWTLGAL